MNQSLVDAVTAAMEKAVKQHGPLTDDPCRAMVILTEEVGEAARDILEIRRAPSHLVEKHRRECAVNELVQVMATAAHLINNLGTL